MPRFQFSVNHFYIMHGGDEPEPVVPDVENDKTIYFVRIGKASA